VTSFIDQYSFIIGRIHLREPQSEVKIISTFNVLSRLNSIIVVIVI
jgi:hypothetical protein